MLNSLKNAFIYFNFRFKEFQGFFFFFQKAGFTHTCAPKTLKQRQKVESGENSESSSAHCVTVSCIGPAHCVTVTRIGPGNCKPAGTGQLATKETTLFHQHLS